MKKYIIISLGRLGQAFYHSVVNHHQVLGTYCTHAKSLDGEVQYNFQCDSIPNALENSDVVLFNLTPSTIKDITYFKRFLSSIKTKKFIFISSTSVYGNQGEVDEDTEALPETSSGKLLRECEQLLLNSDLDVAIIRPSGLYSDNFHPGKYMAGRTLDINGASSVNLIHIDDLVKIINVAKEKKYPIINATNINHPSKKEYYVKYCETNNLAIPKFLNKDIVQDKIIHTKYKEFEVQNVLP